MVVLDRRRRRRRSNWRHQLLPHQAQPSRQHRFSAGRVVKHCAIAFALSATACGGGATFKVEIQDACNATAFDGNNVSFVELSVESPNLDAPIRATFDASGQSGSLENITAVTQ